MSRPASRRGGVQPFHVMEVLKAVADRRRTHDDVVLLCVGQPSTPAPDPVRAQADGERLPPPPIFECTTYDNDHYLSDDGTPSERCVALDVTGIGDGAAPGVGAACQKTTDSCQRVPDGGACDAWKRREREARASLMFGKSEDKDKNQAEYERVQRVVTESTCGG